MFFVFGFLVPFTFAQAFISFSFSSGLTINNNSEKDVSIEKSLNSQNMEILQAATHINPNPAKGGGEITVLDNTALLAESGISGTMVDIEKVKNGGKISLYVVKDGDSLSQIANMFGVSVNTIRWANDFKGDIQPGQDLIILPVNGVKHTVKSGGTIGDLAKMYSADANEIALFNGVDVNKKLSAGDEIIIPNADPLQIVDESGKTKKIATKKPAGDTPKVSYNGYYSNPLPGSIVTQGLHGYNGVDFGAPLGTPIRAAANGTVITSKQGGWNGGYGSIIVISHPNGTETLYSHQSENAVATGQKVKAGEIIGYVGSTGKSTGNHLHFEVRGAKNPWGNCAEGKVCK